MGRQLNDLIRNVIFDMDGTLVDTETLYFDLIKNTCGDYGVVLEDELFSAFYSMPLQNKVEIICERYDLSCSVDELIRSYRKRQNEVTAQEIEKRIYPDTIRTLKLLKDEGYRLFVCSSSRKVTIERYLGQTEMGEYIDGYICGDEGFGRKPDPQIYFELLKREDLRAKETVAVEDAKPGVISAQDAGIFCFGIRRSDQTDCSMADCVIDDLTEIKDVLKKTHKQNECGITGNRKGRRMKMGEKELSRQIVHIEPLFESFVWGGTAVIDKFKLKTDLENIGQMYHVIALKGDWDNTVRETGEKLSEYYENHPEVFDCKCPVFPVRLATSCSHEGARQSIQVHPDNEYAFAHEGTMGKVSGGVNLAGDPTKPRTIYMGHTCKTREEFEKLVEEKDWERLFQKITIQPDEFMVTPAGVLHGVERKSGGMSIVFATNSDITYRLYDHDRNDPNRPLHIKQVYDCLHFPEVELKPEKIKVTEENGCVIREYHSKAGEFTGKRIEVETNGTYEMDEFYFLTCTDGQCTINGVPVDLGETVLIPAHFGKIEIEGKVQLYLISYFD